MPTSLVSRDPFQTPCDDDAPSRLLSRVCSRRGQFGDGDTIAVASIHSAGSYTPPPPIATSNLGRRGSWNSYGLHPRQLHVFDDPNRDERGWVLSVAHVEIMRPERLGPRYLETRG